MKFEKYSQLVFILVMVGIFSIGYFYFSEISPVFVKKPDIKKPITQEITSEHIIYLLNEMDAYKLHEDPLSKELPIIEVKILEESYLYTVKDNQITETAKNDPDITLTTTKEKIIELFHDNKKISECVSLESYADEKTLALKGYKIIYDNFSGNEITGNIIKINPIFRGINLIFFLFVSIIIGLIIDKI